MLLNTLLPLNCRFRVLKLSTSSKDGLTTPLVVASNAFIGCQPFIGKVRVLIIVKFSVKSSARARDEMIPGVGDGVFIRVNGREGVVEDQMELCRDRSSGTIEN